MAKIQQLLCFTLIFASVSLLEMVSAHETPTSKSSVVEIELPKTVKEVEPYTVKVVMVFVSDLEKKCPKTSKFTAFFERLRAYAKFVCPLQSSDQTYERDMKAKAGSLFQSISSFAVGKIRAKIQEEKMEAIENFKMMKTIAGKIIGTGKENEESKTLTAEQQKEIKEGILKWESVITKITETMKESTTTSSSSSSSSEVSTSAKGTSSKSSGGRSTTFSDTTGSSSSMGSPSGSPKNKPSASKDVSESSSGKGISFTDTTGVGKISPSGSPKGGKEYATGKSSTSSAASPKSSRSSSKDTKSSSSSSEDTTGGSMTTSKDASVGGKTSSTGTKDTAGGSMTTSKDATAGGKTSSTGTKDTASGSMSTSKDASVGGKSSSTETSTSSSSSSATVSATEVEEQTSKEIMTFIMNLEKKCPPKEEYKSFFEKLKSTMTGSASGSPRSSRGGLLSGIKQAAGKLGDAMQFMRARIGVKSAEVKQSLESYQAEVLKAVEELDAIHEKILSENKSKQGGSAKITTQQQTEIRQTITKWEKVTTQFVETAVQSESSSSSSSSSSTSSSSSSGSGAKKMVQEN